MVIRSVLGVALLLLLSACGNGIDQVGNALTGDSVDPDGATQGDGDWVALENLQTSFNNNAIGTVRFRAEDGNAIPYDGLRGSDFLVYEDGTLLVASDARATLATFSSLSGQIDTVVLVDVSASISETYLATVRQAIRSALVRRVNSSGLLVGQRIALYAVDSRVRRVVDFTDDENLLERALDSLQRSVSPSSNLYGAVALGVDAIESTFSTDIMRTGAVLLITDGRDTANRVTLADVVQAIDGKLVYSVGVGSSVDSASLALIGTAGSFTLSDYTALEGALQTVRSRLQREIGSIYELRYASPKRRASGAQAASNHRFELAFDNNANAGRNARISADFNSYDFADVRPEVRIVGDRQLNVGETLSYTAQTDWSSSAQHAYSWTLSGNGCVLESTTDRSANVLGVQRGACQLLAVDTTVSASVSVALTVDQAVVEF